MNHLRAVTEASSTVAEVGDAIPCQLPPAVVRSPELVRAVRAESLAQMGVCGPAARAWEWALTGTCASPVTGRQPTPGSLPSREELITEAKTAGDEIIPPFQRIYDTDQQVSAARRILEWLSGNTDEIPLPTGNRGRFIGARDDYARTDGQIREVLAWARFGLARFDLPDPMDPAVAMRPWQWQASWMDAAWLRGARDMLAWVCGEHDQAPLSGTVIRLPSLADAADEYGYAYDVLDQGRPGGQPVQLAIYPPPQYGEAVQAAYCWLSGERTSPPADRHGHGHYSGCREQETPCICGESRTCLGNDCAACLYSPCALSRSRAD